MRLFRRNIRPLATTSGIVREMDRVTIEEYGLPGIALMENAGAAAAIVAEEMCPPGRPVLVMAGTGNNAGDGFVIARLLANRGRSVDVLAAAPGHLYKGDAAINYRVIAMMGLPVETWEGRCPAAHNWGLIVDALLGTGLSGNLRPPYPAMIDFLNNSGIPVLAVDIPSGLDSDTGEIHTAAVMGAKTVTFALPKEGLFVGEGPRLAGEVILADIGIPGNLYPAGKGLPHICE